MLFNPQSIDCFIDLIYSPKTTKISNELEACLIVSGADHGIAREKFSRYQYGETLSVLKFSASNHSPVSILSSSLGMKKYFFNIGCTRKDENPFISNQFYQGAGTNSIADEDAMAVGTIDKIFEEAKYFIPQIQAENICLGEVGIGNTISTTVLTSIITKQKAEAITGKGSGINDQQLNQKIKLIKKCIERHKTTHNNIHDPLILLQSLGGLEIVWNIALILQASKNNKMVFLDGYISTLSAAVAFMIDSQIKQHLIATHLSREPGHQFLLNFIGLRPFLNLDLALGQGFGAVLGFSFINSQRKVFHGKLKNLSKI
ncbi:nicotinate-nucleotide--dimethylbenzimidazole phosphoribosyltransferase [Candidatus Protochlamydia sp. W-9]|uniref:nicotinate-nucleotide--dimethylbenzimidazole phosphoribosyltransferase n=1 Tax=Candidatus Protochlamydia sp. W-9 TaxID=1785087 RepID=UPI00096A60DD|nr:nicotinate-nucleotide--dimethylbenzimidazole phosphoribosyltransferase [Candidatus Protochlamydia sp. W-9]